MGQSIKIFIIVILSLFLLAGVMLFTLNTTDDIKILTPRNGPDSNISSKSKEQTTESLDNSIKHATQPPIETDIASSSAPADYPPHIEEIIRPWLETDGTLAPNTPAHVRETFNNWKKTTTNNVDSESPTNPTTANAETNANNTETPAGTAVASSTGTTSNSATTGGTNTATATTTTDTTDNDNEEEPDSTNKNSQTQAVHIGSNIFTVTWLSSQSATGTLALAKTKSDLNNKTGSYLEFRDARSQRLNGFSSSQNHIVHVSNLQSSTWYYYQTITNDTLGEIQTVRTAADFGLFPIGKDFKFKVLNRNHSPATGAIVFLQIQSKSGNSQKRAYFVNSDGSLADGGNLLTFQQGNPPAGYYNISDPVNDLVVIEVEAGPNGSTRQIITVQQLENHPAVYLP